MKIKDLEQKERVPYYTKSSVNFAYFYRACAYRWEETADPERKDEASFLTEKEAIEYTDNLNLEVGFRGVVERCEILISDFDEDEEFNLDDLIYKHLSYFESNEIYSTNEFTGKSIEGSIIIEWSYEKYVGYARNLINIGVGGTYPFHELKTESDMITGNEERTFRSNYSVLLSKEEVKDSGDLLAERIMEELETSHWKWNYFKNNSESAYINERIQEITA